jgi:hypothetical protein
MDAATGKIRDARRFGSMTCEHVPLTALVAALSTTAAVDLGGASTPTAPSYRSPGKTAGLVMYVLDNESDASCLPGVRANIDALHVGIVGSNGVGGRGRRQPSQRYADLVRPHMSTGTV